MWEEITQENEDLEARFMRTNLEAAYHSLPHALKQFMSLPHAKHTHSQRLQKSYSITARLSSSHYINKV